MPRRRRRRSTPGRTAAASEPAPIKAVPAFCRGGRRYRRITMLKNYTALLLHRDSALAYLTMGGAFTLALAYAFFFPGMFPGSRAERGRFGPRFASIRFSNSLFPSRDASASGSAFLPVASPARFARGMKRRKARSCFHAAQTSLRSLRPLFTGGVGRALAIERARLSAPHRGVLNPGPRFAGGRLWPPS